MPGESPDRKNRRKKNGGGKNEENRIWQSEHVAQRDVARRQLSSDVLVEIVGDIEQDDEQRKSERSRQENLEPFGEYVPVERADYSHDSAGLATRRGIVGRA